MKLKENLGPNLKELWENISRMTALGLAIENKTARKHPFTKKDKEVVIALNQHIKAKLGKISQSSRRSPLNFANIYEIDMMHSELVKIFKLKNGELVFNYNQRFKKIKEIYEDYLPIEPSPYPDSTYKSMAIPKRELEKVLISSAIQLDSPSKYADYAQSKIFKVSSKTIERYRLNYKRKSISLITALKCDFPIDVRWLDKESVKRVILERIMKSSHFRT